MRRGLASRWLGLTVTGLTAVLASAVLAAPAGALAPPTPWDGANPFHCTLQNAGQGTTVPDPGADPYCVYFDKTHQSVTDGGIVDFLLKEPARVAAASPKCFYFQSDHWRGTLNPGDPNAIYEFEGHYFFNKATGDGGVWVTGFTVNGQTFDPTSLPGFPPGYGGDFGPGTGGFITHDEVPTDPQCVAQAAQSPGAVYNRPPAPRCTAPGGAITARRLGPVALGTTEDRVRARLGPPAEVKRGFLHYCVAGGGTFMVGQPGDRSGTLGSRGRAPTVILITTARSFRLHRGHRTLSVGSRLRSALRLFPHARALGRAGSDRLFILAPGLLAGVRRGQITYLGDYARRRIRSRAQLIGYARRV